ncbi:MAG: ABC transporter ATP-binding protein [Verrucomicrobia bacterium]|nr:ABC transporter ATP-binding protein [Verrucomicrobiota bacterium]
MADFLVGTNLVKAYPVGQKQLSVLRGASLSAREGEMLVIMGASGVGKSTLLHILGTLDRPDSGQVFFDGQDVASLSDAVRSRFRNREVGFVFQFYHLLADFTAIENVLIPARIGRRRGAENSPRHRAIELLEAVGLSERLHHRTAQLSGGEQQRVAIARALMNAPRLLLADEPTGNLDTATSNEIHQMLRRINRERRQTMVIVTHDEGLASLADRVLHMVDGIIVDANGVAGNGL